MRIEWESLRLRLASSGFSRWQRGLLVDPTWRRETYDHDVWLIWAGHGSIKMRQGQVELRPGRWLWMTPGFWYDAQQDPKDPIGHYYFHFDLLRPDGKVRPYDAPRPPEFIDYWNMLFGEAAARHIIEVLPPFILGQWAEAVPAMRRSFCETLLKAVLMGLDAGSSDDMGPGTTQGSEHRRQMTELAIHIRADPASAGSIAKMAEKAGYTPAHFSRVFKSVVGETPREFVLRTKVERAAALLAEPSLAIKQVAEMLGYDNVYFFSNQFKARTGKSPAAYRRERGTASVES